MSPPLTGDSAALSSIHQKKGEVTPSIKSIPSLKQIYTGKLVEQLDPIRRI